MRYVDDVSIGHGLVRQEDDVSHEYIIDFWGIVSHIYWI